MHSSQGIMVDNHLIPEGGEAQGWGVYLIALHVHVQCHVPLHMYMYLIMCTHVYLICTWHVHNNSVDEV